MRSGETFTRSPERRGNDEADLGLDLGGRLAALSDKEAALLFERLNSLDPHDPQYIDRKLAVAGDTLKEIEEARRQSKGENDE